MNDFWVFFREHEREIKRLHRVLDLHFSAVSNAPGDAPSEGGLNTDGLSSH